MRTRVLLAVLAFAVLAPPAHAVTRGRVTVPLDRAHPAGKQIRIAYERYVRSDKRRPSLGTMVAIEGGPGFSTTDSRDSYLELLKPLMKRRDLLLVDNRGTGLSSPLDCPALHRALIDYVERAGDCARQIGPSRDLYDTHYVVDDLAAVLDKLGIDKIDLYGDSYGSYAAQAFAVRHGDRLRSLVLDGAYPLPGTDPAFGDLAEATWRGLTLVCERHPGCKEDARAALARLVARVRRSPVRGQGRDADGKLIPVTVSATSLTSLVQSAYGSLSIYRDLPGALDAFSRGDRAPLLRLVAENTLDPHASPVRSFSDPLYLAVTCHDYPQLWDPAAPIEERRTQLVLAQASQPPARFAPFSATEWTSLDYEGGTACLHWPGSRVDDPPVPPGAPYPDVPVLVLNGDLDNITASSGARVVASRFPRATFVETRNTVHISALGDRDGCAAPMVRRFIASLSAGDTSCAQRIAEVRTAGGFARLAGGSGRSVALAAAETVADAIMRWQINYSGTGRGLRGGSWSYTGSRLVRFRFRGARFRSDVPVTGTASWRISSGAVRADLHVPGGHVRAAWNVRRRLARATLRGRVRGRALNVDVLAP
jgi:pimeloyl-ACP methyl ester carboxylesterase